MKKPTESPEQAAKRKSRNAELRALIRPLVAARYEVDVSWNYLEKHLQSLSDGYGGVEFEPDFQRGHVWTADQQQHYIENVLRGIVATSGLTIQLNCPNWDRDDVVTDMPHGVCVVDGLQRMTAVLQYIAGNVRPFGLSCQELEGTEFSLNRIGNRFRVAVHNFTRRAELLQHYLDLNAGGTPHAPEEIERVRNLLAASRT